MEENKNGAPRQGGHKHKHFRGHQNRQNGDRAEGGQRISVRPGNFNPPAQPGTPAAAPRETAEQQNENPKIGAIFYASHKKHTNKTKLLNFHRIRRKFSTSWERCTNPGKTFCILHILIHI